MSEENTKTEETATLTAASDYALGRALRRAEQAEAQCRRAQAERDQARRERDAVARELAASLVPDDLGLLCSTAVNLWGTNAQTQQAIEELCELSVACSHRLRGRINTAELATEIADVEIMLEQLRLMVRNYSGTDETMATARKTQRDKLRAAIDRRAKP
jgi:hypothetical protein